MNRNIKVISFDVYDTLIRRIVSSKAVYQRMGKALIESGDTSGVYFYEQRTKSEELLMSQGKDVYTLSDIYHQEPFSGWTEEKLDAVMELERSMEEENTLPTVLGQRLFHEYEKRYTLVCISDMYFDGDFIKKCLQKNGYVPYRVYVSSDIGKSKRRRGLFKFVLEDMGIKPSEMLHIGDAIRSDWLHARLEGIHGKWLCDKEDLSASEDSLYNFGYSVLGPVLFEFCKWVRQYEGRGRMLFLAREGEFLKQCYDILYPDNKSKILYLSRKSVMQGTAYTLLQNLAAEEFYHLINIERRERIKDVFHRLGLDATQYNTLLFEEQLTPDDLYDGRIIPFLKKNRDMLMKDMEPKHELFRAYLEEHLALNNVLVDIGWKGRMQNFLQRYIEVSGGNVKLSGLYFGIRSGSEYKQGFLFDSENKRCHDVLCFSGMLEILMVPGHGSTIWYEAHDGTIIPVFDQFEFSEEDYKRIRRVQRGVENMFQEHILYRDCQCFDIEQATKRLVHFGCHPPRQFMKEIGPLELYENGNTHRLIEHTSLLHPKEFYKGFFYSKWKSGYLKENFVLDLPYERLISLVRRHEPRGGVTLSNPNHLSLVPGCVADCLPIPQLALESRAA